MFARTLWLVRSQATGTFSAPVFDKRQSSAAGLCTIALASLGMLARTRSFAESVWGHFSETSAPTAVGGASLGDMTEEGDAMEGAETPRRSPPLGIPGVGQYRWHLADNHLVWSDELLDMYGLQAAPEDEQGFFRCIHHDDRMRVEAEMADAIAGSSQYTHEFRICRPDGTVRVILDRGVVERDEAGRAVALEGVDVDVTDLRSRQFQGGVSLKMNGDPADLATPEAHLSEANAILHSLFDAAPVGLGIWDRDLRFVRVNPRLADMNGLPLSAHLGRRIDEILPDVGDSNAIMERWRKIIETGQPWTGVEITGETPAHPGETRHWCEHFFPVRASDRIIGLAAVVEDITERKRATEQVDVLLREVNHRSKNLLGLVQAVARQTIRANPEDFLARFQSRIEGLAASQDLLVSQAWENVRLGDLVRSQLAHFHDLIGHRIILDGPPRAKVTAQAAQTLGMAFHELATNAAKHGALSIEAGRVSVKWELRSDDRELRVTWRERGGPHVASPQRRGFGTMIVNDMVRSMLEADVGIDYAPEGLTWTVAVGGPAVSTSVVSPDERYGDGRPRVLLVEDECLIALDLAASLETEGFDVVGPARNVSTALELLSSYACDAAILDVNLGGGATSEPVAEALMAENRPFVVVSGFSTEQIPEKLRAAPNLAKPVKHERLAELLRDSIRREMS